MASLNLAMFKIREAVLQIKYSPAFRFWDHSGEIWLTLEKKINNLKIKGAEPNRTVFVLERNYEFHVEVDNFRIIAIEPQTTLKDFIDKSSILYNVVTNILELKEFSRIGFRLIYERGYESIETASTQFLEFSKLAINNEKLFGIDGKIIFPEIAFRNEDESNGTAVRIKTEIHKIDFEPPITMPSLKPISQEFPNTIYDIDYYTKKVVTTDQLNLGEWMKQVQHLINRDSDKILG